MGKGDFHFWGYDFCGAEIHGKPKAVTGSFLFLNAPHIFTGKPSFLPPTHLSGKLLSKR